MSWKRKPTKQMPVTIDRAKGKVTQKVAHQNEPKPWEFWLRPGVLCEATCWHISNPWGREVHGLPTLARSMVPHDTATIKKGDLVTFIGRVVENGRYSEHYQFLTVNGIVIANPSGFKDARDDENGV